MSDKIKKAIKDLKEYNQWRAGAMLPQPSPVVITAAIDTAIEALETQIATHNPQIECKCCRNGSKLKPWHLCTRCHRIGAEKAKK